MDTHNNEIFIDNHLERQDKIKNAIKKHENEIKNLTKKLIDNEKDFDDWIMG